MKRILIFVLVFVLSVLSAGCAAQTANTEIGAPGGAPTAEPSPTPKPDVAEDFSAEPANWSEALIVAGQADGVEITTEADALRFMTKKAETYAYKFYNKENYEDVIVEAEISNSGSTTNGIALVCRASDLGWYEFRISSGGTYEFYRYDQKLKDQGSNPYKMLDSGGSALIVTGQKTNRVKLICSGQEMKVYVNEQELKPAHGAVEDGNLSTGKVGVGVMAFALTPVTVDFNSVLISRAQ